MFMSPEFFETILLGGLNFLVNIAILSTLSVKGDLIKKDPYTVTLNKKIR